MDETSLDTRLTVLIVDDVAVNNSVMAAALGDEFVVLSATSGAQALQLIRREPAPDLVILDVMMPDPDGFEVCRLLKADAATATIPVIFVTSLDDKVNEEYGFTLGAVDYVYKPINPHVVRARVRLHAELRLQREFLERLLVLRSEELAAAQAEARRLLGG